MGRPKMQTEINAIAEEPEDNEYSSKRAALACMVNSEVGAVLAVMRRNVRWGGRYVTGDDQSEHALVYSLKALRKQIFSWQQQWQTINPTTYLKPFLDVIRSDETGAPITGVALSSVYKILTLEIFDLNTVNVEEAMHMVVDAVTSCRFEVTDPASEEVVLMKILQVLLACMKSKASVMLHNQHVCTIVNTCFRVVHQAGTKGELLQRIARHTMHELVRCIFSHLSDIGRLESTLASKEGSHHSPDALVRTAIFMKVFVIFWKMLTFFFFCRWLGMKKSMALGTNPVIMGMGILNLMSLLFLCLSLQMLRWSLHPVWLMITLWRLPITWSHQMTCTL